MFFGRGIHIAAPLGIRTGFVAIKATNMVAPLGLYLKRLVHQSRQKNVPRLFEFLVRIM